MHPEIKLVISHNDKVIQTVTKEISEAGLVKAIENFIVIANTTMTNLIDDSGDSGSFIMGEEDEDSENEEDECASPKKSKK